MALFQKRKWEGNVREMENLIIQGILFSSGEQIRPSNLGLETGREPVTAWDATLDGLPYKQAKEKTLQHFNHAYIGHLLASSKGNVTHAARAGGDPAADHSALRYRCGEISCLTMT